jgi:ATP-dependent Zn protease
MAERTAIMLDGRAAEKIRFDDFSTGAGEEREKGTRLARHMVCQGG